MEQLTLPLEQPAEFSFAKARLEELDKRQAAIQDALTCSIAFMRRERDKCRKQLQDICIHPSHAVIKTFDHHNNYTAREDVCDLCGKVLRYY
jgi:hypothetical protein